MNVSAIFPQLSANATRIRWRLDSRAILRLILILSIAWASISLLRRLVYEAQGPINWDTTIYMAMGRSILNGLTPWKDLFETKPPGIFLMAAADLACKGMLFRVLQIVAILTVCVTPVILLTGQALPEKREDRWLLAGLLLLYGLLIGLYCATRAGEIQVESFGAAASSLAILGMSAPLVKRWPRCMLVLATLGWLGAGMLKEPFIFSLFGAALLMLRSRHAWLRGFLLPATLAALVAITGLACVGWLGSYVHDYLGYMSSYAGRAGSPWHRALDVSRIWNDLNNFSAGLGWFVCLLPLTHLMLFSRADRDHAAIFERSIRLMLAVLCASFSVGLGGEYWNHHYVFAVPVMLALVACLIPQLSFLKRWSVQTSTALLTAVLCFSTLGVPIPNYSKEIHHQHLARERLEKEANYIDAILDRHHLQRYAFVGGNGEQIFAYTRHSPLGPMFLQLGKHRISIK